jgi:hypothetical protein
MSHYIDPEALAGNISGDNFLLGLPVLFQGSKSSERPARQAASFENCGPLFAAASRPRHIDVLRPSNEVIYVGPPDMVGAEG